MAINDIEFLRYLIDYIDSKKEPELEPELEVEPETPTIIIINKDNDDEDFGDNQDGCEYDQPEDVENALDRDDVFIPPLQAKLEIMKKMAGIEPKNQDLLTAEADEDEPFEG